MGIVAAVALNSKLESDFVHCAKNVEGGSNFTVEFTRIDLSSDGKEL